ncbi:MAG: hypothetical protein NVS2B14_07870 [Chamaesiphon sp.]
MSGRDSFTGGFMAGAVVGGLVGAVVGALFVFQRAELTGDSEASLLNPSLSEAKAGRSKKRQFKEAEGIEASRRTLEDKIAQLNAAIDEVRLSLGTVNGNALEIDPERSQSLDS